MAQCPVCHNELPDDFGLIECGKCKTPLFVQLDGSVVAAPAAVEADQPQLVEPTVLASALEEPLEDNLDRTVVLEMNVSERAENELTTPDIPGGQEFPVEEEIHSEQFVSAEPEIQAEQALPVEQNVDAFLEEPPLPAEPPPPIHDLSALANSVDNVASSGVLRYTIEVSGIDTADIRNEFRELIGDRRFLWDADSIIRSLRSGSVTIKDVTAVKALLLVHRLRSLPVRVQWEQHVLHES